MRYKLLSLLIGLLCAQAHIVWGIEPPENIIFSIALELENAEQDGSEQDNPNDNEAEKHKKIEEKYPGWKVAIQRCYKSSTSQLYPWWKTLHNIGHNTGKSLNYNVDTDISSDNFIALVHAQLKQLKIPYIEFQEKNRYAAAITYWANQKLEKEWEVITKHNKHIEWDMTDEQWAALRKTQEDLLPNAISHFLNECSNPDQRFAFTAQHQLGYIARHNWETQETKNLFIKSCLNQFKLHCGIKNLSEQKSAS